MFWPDYAAIVDACWCLQFHIEGPRYYERKRAHSLYARTHEGLEEKSAELEGLLQGIDPGAEVVWDDTYRPENEYTGPVKPEDWDMIIDCGTLLQKYRQDEKRYTITN